MISPRIMQSSLKPGDMIQSSSTMYQVYRPVGSGTSSVVWHCRNFTSTQMVALKVLCGPNMLENGHHEAKIHRYMTTQGSEHFHIVRWLGSFQSPGRFCHEFETLNITLSQFLKKCPRGSLKLREIRPIIGQIAEALLFLQRVGIIHCDLKPDNIMMIDHIDQPLRIKITDFGIASSVKEAKQEVMRQTLWYRAPEILLGAPVHEAIDMWSLGCIASQMFQGNILFLARNEMELMKLIVEAVGHPPISCLNQGLFTSHFYSKCKFEQKWIYKVCAKCVEPGRNKYLENFMFRVPFANASEDHDRVVFKDLLKRMLDPNPETRMRPEEVLQHTFITMGHLQWCELDYFGQSHKLLCQAWQREPPTNFAPFDRASQAPPTMADSENQRNIHKEQESPSKKRRLDEDTEHRSKESNKRAKDSAVWSWILSSGFSSCSSQSHVANVPDSMNLAGSAPHGSAPVSYMCYPSIRIRILSSSSIQGHKSHLSNVSAPMRSAGSAACGSPFVFSAVSSADKGKSEKDLDECQGQRSQPEPSNPPEPTTATKSTIVTRATEATRATITTRDTKSTKSTIVTRAIRTTKSTTATKSTIVTRAIGATSATKSSRATKSSIVTRAIRATRDATFTRDTKSTIDTRVTGDTRTTQSTRATKSTIVIRVIGANRATRDIRHHPCYMCLF